MIGKATATAAASVRRGGSPRVPAEVHWTAAMRARRNLIISRGKIRRTPARAARTYVHTAIESDATSSVHVHISSAEMVAPLLWPVPTTHPCTPHERYFVLVRMSGRTALLFFFRHVKASSIDTVWSGSSSNAVHMLICPIPSVFFFKDAACCMRMRINYPYTS